MSNDIQPIIDDAGVPRCTTACRQLLVSIIRRLAASRKALLAACERLLWLLEVEHKIDTGHIGRDARAAIAAAEQTPSAEADSPA